MGIGHSQTSTTGLEPIVATILAVVLVGEKLPTEWLARHWADCDLPGRNYHSIRKTVLVPGTNRAPERYLKKEQSYEGKSVI